MRKNETNFKKTLKKIEKEFAFLEKLFGKFYRPIKKEPKTNSKTLSIKKEPNANSKTVYYYGYQITTGFDGKSYIKEFGNVRPMDISLIKQNKTIDPHIDTKYYNKINQYIITAEMPGVSIDDVKIKIDGNLIEISTDNNAKNYFGKILVKRNLENKIEKMTYVNGILELRINAITLPKNESIEVS
ncbi:MAG: Hsp20/alpha crystallin family protein [Nitrososphaeraceae archaeon]